MKRVKPLLMLLLSISLLTACGSENSSNEVRSTIAPTTKLEVPTPTKPPIVVQPTAIEQSKPTINAYGYEVKDVGDGWNEGIVYFFFENTGDSLVPSDLPPRSDDYYDISNVVVETQEGKTYPARVTSRGGSNALDLRAMPMIPPGFRVESGVSHTENDGFYWGSINVTFKFAQAAHPTIIKFLDKPNWTINLAEATKARPNMPTDLPLSSFESINVISGTVLLDEPEKVIVTLGECVVISNMNGPSAYLTYTAVNRDQLDKRSTKFQFPPHVIVQHEEMWYEHERTTMINLGPGQSMTDNFFLTLNPDGSQYVIIYQSDGKYKIYTTDDCKPKKQ